MEKNTKFTTLEVSEVVTEGAPLENDLSFIIAINALASGNNPNKISNLVETRVNEIKQLEKQVNFVERARESLFKTMSLMGTPRAMNGIFAVLKGVDEQVKSQVSNKQLRGKEVQDYSLMNQRGRELFDRVYTSQADKIYKGINQSYPDLADFVVTEFYGKMMGDMRIINAIETELCFIGALVPLNVPTQLKSHVLGAQKLGASQTLTTAALNVAKLILTKHL